VNPPAPGKHFERLPHQAGIGNDLGGDVDQRSKTAEENDDPQPIAVRTTANEVDNGHRLENQTPGKE
jgi:hypothetical protein